MEKANNVISMKEVKKVKSNKMYSMNEEEIDRNWYLYSKNKHSTFWFSKLVLKKYHNLRKTKIPYSDVDNFEDFWIVVHPYFTFGKKYVEGILEKVNQKFEEKSGIEGKFSIEEIMEGKFQNTFPKNYFKEKHLQHFVEDEIEKLLLGLNQKFNRKGMTKEEIDSVMGRTDNGIIGNSKDSKNV